MADGRSLSNGGISRGRYRYSPRDGATWGHQPVRARRRGAFSSSCRPPWIASSRAPTRAGFNRIRSVPIPSIETKNVDTDNEVCARSKTRMGLKGTLLDYNYQLSATLHRVFLFIQIKQDIRSEQCNTLAFTLAARGLDRESRDTHCSFRFPTSSTTTMLLGLFRTFAPHAPAPTGGGPPCSTTASRLSIELLSNKLNDIC